MYVTYQQTLHLISHIVLSPHPIEMKKRNLDVHAGETSALHLPTPELQRQMQILQDFGFKLDAFQSHVQETDRPLQSHVHRDSLHVSDLWSQRHRKSFLIVTGLEEAQNARIRQARLQPLAKRNSSSDPRLCLPGKITGFQSETGPQTTRAKHTYSHSSPWTHNVKRDQKMNMLLSKLEDTVGTSVAQRKTLSLLYSEFQRLKVPRERKN